MNQVPLLVDLVSDTATRPSDEMRAVMAHAPVGDEQLGEDPSVNALTEKVTHLLGKPAALFLPSGTMANQIALAVHCNRGDAILAARNSHIVGSEGAGAAVLAGAVVLTIDAPRGIFGEKELAEIYRPTRVKSPRPAVIEVEQTNNRGGGAVWPYQKLQEVSNFAREHGLVMHMDGARLMNAVVASGVSAKEYADLCDTVWIDLSKGLGCPVGSVLAGSEDFIEKANVWKHRLGGAMRQAGILAAAGTYALDHHVADLAHDHRRAKDFASFLTLIPSVSLLFNEVETNLIFIDIGKTGLTSMQISDRLRSRGVRIGVESATVMRAVFHRDVDDQGLALAKETFAWAVDAR